MSSSICWRHATQAYKLPPASIKRPFPIKWRRLNRLLGCNLSISASLISRIRLLPGFTPGFAELHHQPVVGRSTGDPRLMGLREIGCLLSQRPSEVSRGATQTIPIAFRSRVSLMESVQSDCSSQQRHQASHACLGGCEELRTTFT